MPMQICLYLCIFASLRLGSSQVTSTVTTPVGVYSIENNVDEQFTISTTAYEVNTAMLARDYATAKENYNSASYVKGLARGGTLTGPVFRQAVEYFGRTDFNDEYLVSAFDNGVHVSRVEKVQKTLADSIPVHALLSYAYNASRSNDRVLWDAAAALYIGDLETDLTPYTRANKRAANYGTTQRGSNEAVANVNIIKAFREGPAESAYDNIFLNIKVTYTQCAVRYARLIDEAIKNSTGARLQSLLDDYRAEGQAFYRIIAPSVKQGDEQCDFDMTQLFDVGGQAPSSHGRYYCRALSCIMSSLGLAEDQVGALASTEGACVLSTPVGTFQPQNSVEKDIWMTDTIARVVELVKAGDVDSARQTYLADTDLVALAKGQDLSGSVFDLFVRYYSNNPDFNHKYLINEAFSSTVSASRNEMVEKTLADAIPFQGVVYFANQGATGNRANWDRAAALYVGLLNKGLSPYTRANKRGANYGTLVSNTEEASVNKMIMDAFMSRSSESFETIFKGLKIIYTQATLRYARLLDIDVTSTPQLPIDDHQAEGQAFYRIIAPFVAEKDKSCDNQMQELFSFDTKPDTHGQYYCRALACLPNAMQLTTADLGTLEETMGICSGEAGDPIQTPLRSFIPQTNVQNELNVFVTVSSIMQLVNDGNYNGARQMYLDSAYLMDLAKGTRFVGPVFETFVSHFGTREFNHEYLMDQAFPNTIDASKNEMIEKTIADAIPVQAVISFAYAGSHNGASESWDKAAAMYIGTISTGYTPYTRANKRAANFGTEVLADNGDGQAMVNKQVLEAFQSPSKENYEVILNGIKTTYAQASIRYARLLDIDVAEDLSTDDHRAEGQAFYRIIEPFVASADAECHNQMADMYNLETGLKDHGQYYCIANECLPRALGISADSLGVLEETEGICTGGNTAGQIDSANESSGNAIVACVVYVSAFITIAVMF
eukprot:CAMPEP_0177609542 /NCGR_PEP_ID=MMETSP0419_2-20121207/19156_1 /TAXON_ID=582737 /ORGANISM="Tetraselmis sp., Strain GSL018" /LENGTH=946 /DNA_ID=CAMNT_0019104497 /DNA_START=69 /DNA_END=2909 /DNA_ORIENTATION=-